jgi:thiol-disulfide isomerase/thioredoxin
MKNSIVIAILAALILVACTSTPKSYIVEGVAPDASSNGKMVYMYDYNANKNIDSVLVADGKFTFTGSEETALICRLVLERLYVNLILENGNISVDMADPESAQGSPLNDIRSKYLSELAVHEKELQEKYAEMANMEAELRSKHWIEYYDQYKINVEPIYLKYFHENKNNALGVFVLWDWSNLLDPDRLDSLYIQGGEMVRNFKPLERTIETNAKARQTAEGMPFADFTIENGNVDGSKISLSDYVGKGKYVLVDFWASWCGPCIAEIPVLIEVYNKYKGDKFELLGIAVWDERAETLKSLESHNTQWPQIIDANKIPTDLYGIRGIPHIILFGPDGTIVARDLRGNVLKEKVAEVMQ